MRMLIVDEHFICTFTLSRRVSGGIYDLSKTGRVNPAIPIVLPHII